MISSAQIGRQNLENVAKLMLQWDTDRDGQLSYAELAAAFPALSNVKLTMSPSEIHLSIVDNGDIMVSAALLRIVATLIRTQAMWVTAENTTTSIVQYGTGFPANLTLTASGRHVVARH